MQQSDHLQQLNISLYKTPVTLKGHAPYPQDPAVILESMVDAFTSFDFNYRYTYINKKAEEMLGLKREEALGKTPMELFSNFEQTESYHFFQIVLQENVVKEYEDYYQPWDRWYRIRLCPTEYGVFSYTEDITEKKKVEQKVYFQAHLLDSVSDAVFSTDLDFNVTTWNNGAQKLYGWSEQDALGKNSFELIKTTIVNDDLSTIMNRLEQHGKWSGEVRHQNKDGVEFDILASVTEITDPSGARIGWVTLNRDITERKILTDQIKRNGQRFRALVEKSYDAVALSNLAQKVSYVSPAVEHILGYTPEEFMQLEDHFSLLHPDDQELASELTAQLTAVAGKSVSATYRVKHKDGSYRWLDTIHTNLLHDFNVEAIVSNFRDITELKQREQMKDDFISMASHELKTPLTSLKGFTQLALRRFKASNDSESLRYLKRMEDQVGRLGKLINDLLDVSKAQAGELSFNDVRFDVLTMVKETIENLQPASTHQLIVQGNGKLMIRADRYRLEQVLTNLLNNAIKYSPHAQQVYIHVTEEHNNALIKVEDFGIGMTPEEREHIFERFYRGSVVKEKAFPGLGIGLFVARVIIEHYQGTIEVESTVGQGTTFTIRLPLAA